MMTETTAVPLEIGRANQHDVKIRWQDGRESIYPARALRMSCPCAGCVDEVTGQPRLTEHSVPQDVIPLRIDLVGRYAISITWSDGHNTGIYPFEMLRAWQGRGRTKQQAPSNRQ
jgi:DUF971 family protein